MAAFSGRFIRSRFRSVGGRSGNAIVAAERAEASAGFAAVRRTSHVLLLGKSRLKSRHIRVRDSAAYTPETRAKDRTILHPRFRRVRWLIVYSDLVDPDLLLQPP